MHAAEDGARPVAVHLLRRHLHEDQPHLAHLQPRHQGDGEAAELHESSLPGRHLSVSRLRAGESRESVGRGSAVVSASGSRSRCQVRIGLLPFRAIDTLDVCRKDGLKLFNKFFSQ